jgi:hypothetical protein
MGKEGEWRFAAGILSLYEGIWGSDFPNDLGHIDMRSRSCPSRRRYDWWCMVFVNLQRHDRQ